MDKQYVAALNEELSRARDDKHRKAIRAELLRAGAVKAPARRRPAPRETAVAPAPERAAR